MGWEECCGVHKILKIDQAVRLQCDPEMRKKPSGKIFLKNVKWSKVFRPTRYRIGHFGDVLSSQGTEKPNPTKPN